MATYLHGHHESVLSSHRSRTAANSAGYFLELLQPGDRLLDVGSGPGTITADLAELVAEVVAVEHTEAALQLTRTEIATRGLRNVTFEVGDIQRLAHPDASFDVAHAHQVLQHVADPVAGMRELARVTRPGGHVAVRDSDYSGFFWHPRVPALEDWLDLYRELARAAGGEPDAGRYYPTWAAAAGLAQVSVTCTAWCYTSTEQRGWWAELWARRALESSFATQAKAAGVPVTELQRLSDGWLEWGAAETGMIVLPSIELVAAVE